MQIGKEYKIVWEADGTVNSRLRKVTFADPSYIVYANSITMLDCTFAFIFYFPAFHRLFDNFAVLM